MKRIYISFFVISVAVILLITGSCKSGADKDTQVASIDSLKMILDNMELKLHEVKLPDVNKRFIEYQLTMNKVVANIKQEVDTTSGKYLMAYAKVRIPLKAFIKSLPKLQADLDSTRKQLDNLLNDVEKKLIKKGKFDEYLREESEFVRKLEMNVNEYVDKAKEQVISFDTLNPRINEIIEKYKGKK